MISPQGRARRFASLPPGRFLSGIAFDSTGRFGHPLLVTAGSGGRTTVFGIGSDGRVSIVAAGAPVVEGGIAVAPATFGGFGGDLIAADEIAGRVYAIDPAGRHAFGHPVPLENRIRLVTCGSSGYQAARIFVDQAVPSTVLPGVNGTRG